MQEGVRKSSRLAFHKAKSAALFSAALLCDIFLTKENVPYIAFYVAAGSVLFVHGLKHWKAIIAGWERFSLLLAIDGLFALLTALLLVGVVLIVPDSIVWPLFIVLSL